MKLNPELNVHSWLNIFCVFHRTGSDPLSNYVRPRGCGMECSIVEGREGGKEVAGSLAHQEIIIWSFLANVRKVAAIAVITMM